LYWRFYRRYHGKVPESKDYKGSALGTLVILALRNFTMVSAIEFLIESPIDQPSCTCIVSKKFFAYLTEKFDHPQSAISAINANPSVAVTSL
jgi:hypothetical protein